MLFQQTQLPPRRELAVNRFKAIRGAIAGTILISQVISFASVASEAKATYSNRIQAGRERPLHVAKNSLGNSKNGVVIRLAGKTSDVTSLTMDREGRQHIFPVFEETSLVQSLLRRYSVQQGNFFMVPIYWHVQDERYGFPDSWSGLSIPRSWLFDVSTTSNDDKKSKKLLVLEADANCDDAGDFSIEKNRVTAANLDLDLYEVAQGFYQLQKLVEKTASREDDDEHDTLCVLLADADSAVQRGGGEQMTVRDYVFKFGLADIVIDTRAPVVLALRQWLESRYQDSATKKSKRKHVIIETPEVEWFQSLKKALKQIGGYTVIDTIEATRIYGSVEGLPMIVCESNTINTTHTIRSILKQKMTAPENICGLCSSHQGLEETGASENSEEVTVICSSDLQDRLFRHVREAAMIGYSKDEIQRQLDENLATLLAKSSSGRDWKLRLYL